MLNKVQFENEETGVFWVLEGISDLLEVRCLKVIGFLIRDGQQYEVTDTQSLPSGTTHMYVKGLGADANPYPEHYENPMVKPLEIRNIDTKELIFVFSLQTDLEMIDLLLSSTIYVPVNGNREIGRFRQVAVDSIEFDQDRSCYVYYGSLTGVIVDENGNEAF